MKIAVYCSAKNSIPQEYKDLGATLGAWIAENGHTLVYGGATGGLMTAVSDSVKARGGKVIGVLPHRIIASGRKAENCDELVLVKVMSERKQKMRDIADGFVCLPGSFGTLDEMFDVIASGTVGEHRKPIWIVNYQGFYEPLKAEVQHMKALSFLPKEESYQPVYVETIEELITKINQYDSILFKSSCTASTIDNA